jgi:hypothetical protein
MLKPIQVRDYMNRHPVIFRPETDLFTAIEWLLRHRISGAPVVDAQGHLIGLLSKGDCLRAVLQGAYYESSGGSIDGHDRFGRERLARGRYSHGGRAVPAGASSALTRGRSGQVGGADQSARCVAGRDGFRSA